uniref:Major facilitator superfamily (MFS) profile domain-containing protein n=1 Tax=Lepeophtheirus salmonis TaxID=72036 RepID=A0A0K2UUN1_LEPSM
MILGGSSHTTWVVILIISMEIIPSNKRAIIGSLFQMFWKLGFINLALLAYLIRDHFYLQLAMSLFNLIFISYIWILPESPRWLLSRGKVEEAKKYLRWIAIWNKPPGYSDELLDEKIQMFLKNEVKHEQFEEDPSSFTHIVQFILTNTKVRVKYILGKSILRRRLGLIVYPWMVTGMSYYGIFLSVKLLNASKYIIIVVASVVDIFIQFFAIYFFDKFGRIPTLMFTFSICGISGILIFFTQASDTIIRSTLTIVGKTLSSVSFQGLGLLGPELFPTPIRSEVFSIMDSFSKFGAAIAPFAVDLMSIIDYSLPNVFFGIMILLGGICFLFLPETKGIDVPETVEELKLASDRTVMNKLIKCCRKENS